MYIGTETSALSLRDPVIERRDSRGYARSEDSRDAVGHAPEKRDGGVAAPLDTSTKLRRCKPERRQDIPPFAPLADPVS